MLLELIFISEHFKAAGANDDRVVEEEVGNQFCEGSEARKHEPGAVAKNPISIFVFQKVGNLETLRMIPRRSEDHRGLDAVERDKMTPLEKELREVLLPARREFP